MKNRIEQLYEILIRGFSLTRETLNMYNYTNEDINELVNENIIKEVKPNKWIIANINDMYKYGIKLQSNKQLKKAETCFRICYHQEPTNRTFCIQLLLIELKKENYIAVQKMFSLVEQIEPDKHYKDNNLYLYLLSTILYNNQDYQRRVNNLTEEDILIKGIEENVNLKNKIRQSILKQKYPYAINLINDLKRYNLSYNVELELLKELTINAMNLNNDFKSKLRLAVKNKNYDRILELLEAKSRSQKLSNMEINYLEVTKSIIKILKTNRIPAKDNTPTQYLFEAINNGNYKLAKDINLDFLNYTKQNKDEDILHILLSDICELIEIRENSKKTNVETIVDKICESFEKLVIQNENELTEDEELAYFIKEKQQPIKVTIKALGLLPEQVLTIKLIYARDYFLEGNYEEGNKLLKEVEENSITSKKIINLLQEIKNILNEKKEGYTLTRTKTMEN